MWTRKSDGILPWGWWLRASGSGLEDPDGGTWYSVRDAFWQGRLKFQEGYAAPEQHELLLRVLTAIDNRESNCAEKTHDLFEGNMFFWRFYICWLVSIGLLETVGRIFSFDAQLSDEGKSVMLMLQATRDPDWTDLPISTVFEAVRKTGWTVADDHRERALASFERQVVYRRYVFARERMGQSWLITLTGMGLGARMPVRRVVWSLSFPGDQPRDDLFAWLAERVDRWDDWGTMAYSKGADGLTQHLFTLIVAGGSLRAGTC